MKTNHQNKGLQVTLLRSGHEPRRSLLRDEDNMAEHGEWNQKNATLSDVTAKKEYGVDRDFVIKGIEAGKLEYRDGAMWGNPYLRVLRSQLEKYISAKLGKKYLAKVQNEAELRKIKREISSLSKKLKELQLRKIEIERSLEIK